MKELMFRALHCGEQSRDTPACDTRGWVTRLATFLTARFRTAAAEQRFRDADAQLEFLLTGRLRAPFNLVEDVGAVINKYDPAKLLAVGAPEDEYESEARIIATLLPWVRDGQEMRALAFEVFYRAFHLDIPGDESGDSEVLPWNDPATTAPIADDLMEVWRRHFPCPYGDS